MRSTAKPTPNELPCILLLLHNYWCLEKLTRCSLYSCKLKARSAGRLFICRPGVCFSCLLFTYSVMVSTEKRMEPKSAMKSASKSDQSVKIRMVGAARIGNKKAQLSLRQQLSCTPSKCLLPVLIAGQLWWEMIKEMFRGLCCCQKYGLIYFPASPRFTFVMHVFFCSQLNNIRLLESPCPFVG